MKKPNAKFFCESCGAEVGADAKFCKKCGKFFASVRCPVCGTTGSNEKFKDGCPNCGYAVGREPPSSKIEKTKVSRRAKKQLLAEIERKNPREKSDGSRPSWVYGVLLVLFFVILGGGLKYLLDV